MSLERLSDLRVPKQGDLLADAAHEGQAALAFPDGQRAAEHLPCIVDASRTLEHCQSGGSACVECHKESLSRFLARTLDRYPASQAVSPMDSCLCGGEPGWRRRSRITAAGSDTSPARGWEDSALPDSSTDETSDG